MYLSLIYRHQYMEQLLYRSFKHRMNSNIQNYTKKKQAPNSQADLQRVTETDTACE